MLLGCLWTAESTAIAGTPQQVAALGSHCSDALPEAWRKSNQFRSKFVMKQQFCLSFFALSFELI